MFIDATRYRAFWSSPEAYRLRYIWNLTPTMPEIGMERLLLRGRQRGSAFHDLMDKKEIGNPTYNSEEIAAAREMVSIVHEKYPYEVPLAQEVEFEYPIPDSPHKMVGRIDHILDRCGVIIVGDWKTCGKTTKKELASRIEAYRADPQVSFYMVGARTLGYKPEFFLHRIVQKYKIHEVQSFRTDLELKKFARNVHQTCCIIESMKEKFGVELSWPSLHTKYKSGYAAIEGTGMYVGYTPEGFLPRKEHLSTMEGKL